MGFYDMIKERCYCGGMLEWQSIGGRCEMKTYGIGEAPASVLGDAANRKSKCPDCGRVWRLVVTAIASPVCVDKPQHEGIPMKNPPTNPLAGKKNTGGYLGPTPAEE